MKAKYFIIGGAGLILVALILFSVLNTNNAGAYSTNIAKSTTQNTNTLGSADAATTTTGNGDVQEVRLYMKNYQYVTDPVVLKKGVPVKMTVDLNTVVGCATDIVIKDFGVRKYVSQGDNIITFTPTKTGTIGIACSMNMYHGTFTVVDEANPNAPAEVTASPITPATGGSYGAGGGGCGCGGGA